jgi:hypothetical protein
MISGNIGAAWPILNTIQILAFIPMTNIAIPLKLTKFLASTLEYNVIPNIFE